MLTPSLHVCAKLKQMRRPSPVVPARQDLGTYSDMVMAPQPLGPSGPMARCHLMTVGIRDADMILPQGLLMNMREVPSYCGSRVSIQELSGII